MAPPGENVAITTDGAAYNKLCRPTDFLDFLGSKAPPRERPVPADYRKRTYDDADILETGSEDAPVRKRHASRASVPQSRAAFKSRRPIRPVQECGMQSMFPGLDEDDSSEDATREALAYLRGVRSEATAIPTLLVATPQLPDDEPDRSMYNDGRGDYRAVYRDGTWIALNEYEETYSEGLWSQYTDDLDPQEHYYKSLLRRYKDLRATLAAAVRKDISEHANDHPSQPASTNPPKTRKEWLYALEHEYPTPTRISHLAGTDLYRGLLYCTETLDRYETISKEKSCWVWTLLALAGENGTLDHSRAGRIRDLGHKAGQLNIRLHNGIASKPRMASEGELEDVEDWDMDGEGTGGEDNDPDDENESIPSDLNQSDGVHIANTSLAIPEATYGQVQDNSASSCSKVDTEQVNKDAQPDGPRVSALSKRGEESDASADMSMSEDEGEIKDDDTDVHGLEEARARLLAQLGDRLVQPSIPNLKVPAERELLSRAEAEGLRRNMRQGTSHTKEQREELLEQASSAHPEVAHPQWSSEGALGTCSTSSKTDIPPGTEQYDDHTAEERRLEEQYNRDSQSDDTPIDLNTRVTLDMILTVVAECYGQKDLLRFREVW